MAIAPPSAADPAREAAKIERINELSGLARTAWFALLAPIAFVAVTLLSIGHADLLLDNRQIKLPLVSVDVPTRLFLTLAPVALTVLYVNLHLYLTKLWHAFRDAPKDELGWRLADQIRPWLVNDYALTLKEGCRPRDSGRAFLRNVLTLATCWWAAPAVLAWAWCKSLLMRDPWVSLPILACIAVVLFVGAHGWLAARRELWEKHKPGRFFNAATATIAVLTGFGVYVTLASVRPGLPASGVLVHALDVSGENLAGASARLEPFAFQREAYRQKWCAALKHPLPLDICAKPPSGSALAANVLIAEQQRYCIENRLAPGLVGYRKCRDFFAAVDRRFDEDWLEVRRQALSGVARIDLDAMRLPRLAARGADLTRASLEGADLSRAAMPDVILEGAALRGATLSGAQVYRANLALADATEVRAAEVNLEAATLVGTALRRADLRGAILRGANLTNADLSGADLTGADLRWAGLSRATLDGAVLAGARLEGATGLSEEQLRLAVGTEETEFGVSAVIDREGRFPAGSLMVPSCWVETPRPLASLSSAEGAAKDRFDTVYAPFACDGSGPRPVGKSVGAPRVLPEGNADPRVASLPEWPPGKGRAEPIPAIPGQAR